MTRDQIHSYDIIYGPIANDDIGMQMHRIDADLITWEQFVKEPTNEARAEAKLV